jgi:hypothetical protein
VSVTFGNGYGKWQPQQSESLARIVARRLGISHNTIAKAIRREVLRPDYESDSGAFFDPATHQYHFVAANPFCYYWCLSNST